MSTPDGTTRHGPPCEVTETVLADEPAQMAGFSDPAEDWAQDDWDQGAGEIWVEWQLSPVVLGARPRLRPYPGT